MKTRISPKLKWLEPYVELWENKLIYGKKIVRIGHWEIANKRNGKGAHAAIYTDDWKDYRIWIRSEAHPRGSPIRPQSKIDILTLLAHELAHTLDMDHTPKHKKLESSLVIIFMKKLKEDGYVSEEEELA
jgi:hypothetical protein